MKAIASKNHGYSHVTIAIMLSHGGHDVIIVEFQFPKKECVESVRQMGIRLKKLTGTSCTISHRSAINDSILSNLAIVSSFPLLIYKKMILKIYYNKPRKLKVGTRNWTMVRFELRFRAPEANVITTGQLAYGDQLSYRRPTYP